MGLWDGGFGTVDVRRVQPYEATKAYVEGDLEMVQTYQKNAAVAADPPLQGVPRQLGGY